MSEPPSGESPDKRGGKSDEPVDPRLARRRQDAIGRRLRQMYDEVVKEEVPDDFMAYLRQADEREGEEGDQETQASESKPATARSTP